MNKKFYIRFFHRKEDVIPQNSYPVQELENETINLEYLRNFEIEADIKSWIDNHPDGKVDFVIL